MEFQFVSEEFEKVVSRLMETNKYSDYEACIPYKTLTDSLEYLVQMMMKNQRQRRILTYKPLGSLHVLDKETVKVYEKYIKDLNNIIPKIKNNILSSFDVNNYKDYRDWLITYEKLNKIIIKINDQIKHTNSKLSISEEIVNEALQEWIERFGDKEYYDLRKAYCIKVNPTYLDKYLKFGVSHYISSNRDVKLPPKDSFGINGIYFKSDPNVETFKIEKEEI